MDIAVIGNYKSKKYQELLKMVRNLKPDDRVIDLSRHQSTAWGKQLHDRYTDIGNAHIVIISEDWRDHFETRNDLTHAQKLHKELYLEYEQRFIPFPTHTYFV